MGFPAPEHYQTDEEKKLEVLKYLHDGCWLADTLHKEIPDTHTVHEGDHPAFFVERNPYYYYPDFGLLNQMVRDGLLSIHVSAWTDGERENPHYNLRHFRITDEGQKCLAKQNESG